MSTARLVLTALFVDRQTPAEVAARYGVHRSWVYRLKARYEADGEAAFEPRSRRPKTSPTAIPPATVTLITELRDKLTTAGLDAGPDTIAWHLAHHHGTTISASTVSRYLTRAGLVTPAPKKRPKSSYLRFAATLPNETWQADFTHYRLTQPDGTPGPDAEVLTWLDDCSRYALTVTAHTRVTGPIVLARSGAERGTPQRPRRAAVRWWRGEQPGRAPAAPRGCGREYVGFAGYRARATTRSARSRGVVVAGNGPFPVTTVFGVDRVPKVSWRDPERTLRRLRVLPGSSPMVPSLHPSACYALAAADRRKDAQVNQFHDHGRVRQHAAMTGSRRQAAAAVAPAGWRPSGVGWVCGRRVGASLRGAGCLLGTWGNGGAGDPFARHPTGSRSP
jgi:transposase